jgi:hypothetical protein
VKASHNALVGLFERVESVLGKLAIYNQLSLTTEMAKVLAKIMAESLCILSIATKEVKRKLSSESFLDMLNPSRLSYSVRNIFQETIRKDGY